MMNILDKLGAVLNDSTVKLGFLPDFPDDLSVLTEYRGSPPVHSFGGTDIVENVQLRCRGERSYEKISAFTGKLNRCSDTEISVIQETAILDIGRDDKQRQEYTVNFKIYRR